MSGPLFDYGREQAGRAPRAGDALELARRAGVLSALDRQFANRLCALLGESEAGVRWAAALASRQEALGHVCADLPLLVETGLDREEAGFEEAQSVLATHADLGSWLSALRASRLVDCVDTTVARDGGREADPRDPDRATRPLVLDDRSRLYLRRLFVAEVELAEAIARRAARPDLSLEGFDAAREIEQALKTQAGEVDDAARRALSLGLARPLAILTGGPGTGKTTLVARIVRLAIRQALAREERPPRVLLLAPTGKAAAAMAASFARERSVAGLEPAIRDALPTTAETLHRALARAAVRSPAGHGARAREGSRFEADLVVVDEASMVDLEQMMRLFAACERVPRLILLGDPRQLASVEAGAVLAELCGEDEVGAPTPTLERSLVRLSRSHRYAESGGIGRLAAAVREGDAEAALSILRDPDQPEVELVEPDSPSALLARLAENVRRLELEVARERLPEAKLARLADYRVLCAHRRGAFGVETIARTLDEVAARTRQASARESAWPGRILLVTRNAPEQSLWNGDVGLVERVDGDLRVLFPTPDGGTRTLSLARLPAHESALAMSVHKSQGSEFARVDLVLAAHPTRLMTRELLYTGITRARERLRIHGSEEILRVALARRARRDSGLADRLREMG